VRARLEEAGFSNIQIMSESFLVRAIGPDGSPVVMVVHPDSQALMPEASDDQDAANVRESGDADTLGDLSEDDEEEAVVPTPRSHRFGKSAKTMDRAPAEKSKGEAPRGQRADAPTVTTGREQNAAMGQQLQSNAAPTQLPGQTPNQAQSQSAKMRDEGVRPSADNQTSPGRPNGMASDTKERAQPALDLSNAQRAEIWKRLGNQQTTDTPPGFQPKVGATVPASMQLRSLPNSVSSQVPQVQSYNYAMVQSQLLIVDPATNIRLGTRYLKQTLDKFGDHPEYAFAAYNAGDNRVLDWQNIGHYRDMDEFVESIPFTETREYVQAIIRNEEIYRELDHAANTQERVAAAH